jgi:hypothetical protein
MHATVTMTEIVIVFYATIPVAETKAICQGE